MAAERGVKADWFAAMFYEEDYDAFKEGADLYGIDYVMIRHDCCKDEEGNTKKHIITRSCFNATAGNSPLRRAWVLSAEKSSLQRQTSQTEQCAICCTWTTPKRRSISART